MTVYQWPRMQRLGAGFAVMLCSGGGGSFLVAETRSAGVLASYGFTCGTPANANGVPIGLHCMKGLPIARIGVAHHAARLRLSRWVVTGTFGRLGPAHGRRAHINIGSHDE